MEERQGLLKWTPSAVEREDARAPFGSTFSFDDEEAPPPPQRRAQHVHQAPVDESDGIRGSRCARLIPARV